MGGNPGQQPSPRAEFAAATALEHDDPVLVATVADQLRAAAEGDISGRTSRSAAYVRRLQELTIEQPALGIAVARALGLEHIVEDLLDGMTVDGVRGIGLDGTALPPTRRAALRRYGRRIFVLSIVVLVVEASVVEGMASWVIYVWTALGLGLFFFGGYLMMIRE